MEVATYLTPNKYMMRPARRTAVRMHPGGNRPAVHTAATPMIVFKNSPADTPGM